MKKINQKVLISGAEFFDDADAINAYMDKDIPVDVARVIQEHSGIREALESAGINVVQVPAPEGCQDGVYTANWALCRGDVAIMSSLPDKRRPEEAYAEQILRNLGKKIIHVPEALATHGGYQVDRRERLRFSGQGDALPCGNLLFIGSTYRTDAAVHEFIGKTLGYDVIGLEAVAARTPDSKQIINSVTGWPDSFFYDIDLAIAVIRDNLIAWCPEAFMPASQAKIRSLETIEKIEVSLTEATKGLACNLISTGETVIMSAHAPKLKAAIEGRGLRTITPEVSELAKGGGYIRCSALTID